MELEAPLILSLKENTVTADMLLQYQRAITEVLDRERRMDGVRVEEILTRSLALQNDVCIHLGLPEVCALCSQKSADTDQCPPSRHTGYMPMRCGHRLHTQCYLNMLTDIDITTLTSRCPVCDVHVLEESAIHYYRTRRDGRENTSVVGLWEQNDVFRTELKLLCKKRSKCIKLCTETYRPMIDIKKEYEQITDVSLQTIRMYKKEYMKKISAIETRRSMISKNSRYSKDLMAFCKKYSIWPGQLRTLARIQGTPRTVRGNMQIPWKYRRGISGMFYKKI
jgi:hypothetical protein